MAVSIVSPACSALTSPDSSTLAIFLSEECHTRVRLAFASASNVTDNRSLCPISSESVFLFKRMPRISSASEREEAISVFPYNRLPPEAVPSRGYPAVPCQTFSPFSPATQENAPGSHACWAKSKVGEKSKDMNRSFLMRLLILRLI